MEPLELNSQDSLVIMLGEAVKNIQGLDPVPHALVMPSSPASSNDGNDSMMRLWYGRMIVPSVEAEDDLMLENTHRLLQNETVEDCVDDEYFCWHKCWKPTVDFNVTTESCVGESLVLACANDCGHVW